MDGAPLHAKVASLSPPQKVFPKKLDVEGHPIENPVTSWFRKNRLLMRFRVFVEVAFPIDCALSINIVFETLTMDDPAIPPIVIPPKLVPDRKLRENLQLFKIPMLFP